MRNFRIFFSNSIILLFTLAFSNSIFGQTYNVPEWMYFKYKNNNSSTTPNYASSPVGNLNPSISGPYQFSTGGQFDSCLSGTGTSGGSLNTGWITTFPANWTISFWLGPNQADSGFARYIFGDSTTGGQFRCFYGGAALTNNIILRGSFPDVLIAGVNPQATVVHIVYDGTNVIVYKNGAFYNIFPRVISATGTGPFKVGGYAATSRSLGGKLDEFRMYNRALGGAEIAATWNFELPIFPTGISQTNNNAVSFSLNQNYPNPFNPNTIISFSVPKESFVNIVVTDILGRVVSAPVSGNFKAGEYSFTFVGSNLSSGIYYYLLKTNEYSESRKMVLNK